MFTCSSPIASCDKGCFNGTPRICCVEAVVLVSIGDVDGGVGVHHGAGQTAHRQTNALGALGHLQHHRSPILGQHKQPHAVHLQRNLDRDHHAGNNLVGGQLRSEGSGKLIQDALDLGRRIHFVDVQNVLDVFEQRARFVVSRPVHIGIDVFAKQRTGPTDDLLVNCAAEHKAHHVGVGANSCRSYSPLVINARSPK